MRIFAFLKKKKKERNKRCKAKSIQHLLGREHWRGGVHPERREGPRCAPSQGTALSISPCSRQSCERGLGASMLSPIYSVHLLARDVLRCQKSQRGYFLGLGMLNIFSI